MKSLNAVIAVFFALLLSGCATTKSMSQQDRMRIQKVYVSDSIKMPSEMFYWDRSRSLAVGIGAGLGAAAGSGSSSSGQGVAIGVGTGLGAAAGAKLAAAPSQRVQEAMQQHEIDVAKIVRQSLIQALRDTKKMIVVDKPGHADATMDITVNMYGFGQTQGFSSYLHPTLNMDARITDTSNKIVWKKRDFITPLSKKNTASHTFDGYVSQPENIRNAFNIASKAVAEWLIEKIPPN